jgi:MFS family permease
MQFAIGLLTLGLGWNLLFVGGSTLLTETYRPEEKAKVQGVHDFVVFGVVTLTAFTSGALYSALGWEAVNLGVVVPLLITLAAVVWLSQQQKPSLATPRG